MINISRRKFIRNVGITSLLLPYAQFPFSLLSKDDLNDPLEVHIFSKHLQFLDYKEAGQIATELGFSGLDLTVRPKGHVLPENVITDLPKAIKDIKSAGSSCKLITTAISDASNITDINIIKTAANNGVKFYRPTWFKYRKDLTMEESLNYYQLKVKELGELNKKYNIIGCYQNHAGTSIGASFWELHSLLKTVDPHYFGLQYDIRHALVDGGLSWENGFELLRKKFKTIVLKDFKWGKVNGKWKPINVPVGDGMVDFLSYFKLLKKYKLKFPVSLHLEYPLGGAEKGRSSLTVHKKVVFDAMKKDLMTIQKLWKLA